MRGAKPIDWADDVADLQNAAGNQFYKRVELRWSRPKIWAKEDRLPKIDIDEPFLYMLVRNHGRMNTKDRIEYVGLTASPRTRFGNHKTAKAIVNQHGSVGFSYAPITISRGRNKIDRMTRALQEIEHLLIWSVSDHLWNDKKQFTLPGMGANGGNAWHVINTGYRFSGGIPREIIFPWMLVVPGRDRTVKKAD